MTATEVRTETAAIEVCTGCASLLANGETEGIDAVYWDPETDRDAYHYPRGGPSPEMTERAELAFVAAVESQWSTEWHLSLGCLPSCEHCHGGRTASPCPRCAHGEWPGEVRTLPTWSVLLEYGAIGWTDCPRCAGAGEVIAPEYDGADQCGESFSWSSCDGCGCTLGGDRHPAVATRELDR